MNEMTTTPDEAIALMREMLVEQAVSLNGIFVDMTDHAVEVFKQSPAYAQAYIRLALRAQLNCRSALRVMAMAIPRGAGAGDGAGRGRRKNHEIAEQPHAPRKSARSDGSIMLPA